MRKTCFKCSRELPLDEFYRHPQMADGRLNKCKRCTRRDERQYRHRKMEEPAWRDKQRLRARIKAKEQGRPRSRPERRTARIAVGNAVRDGRLEKPNACTNCGAIRERLEGHHEDYDKPLEVQWLCTQCHGKAHRLPEDDVQPTAMTVEGQLLLI